MDVRHDLEMTFYSPLDEVEPGHLEDLFGDLESRARQILEGDGVREESIVMNRFAAMRYIGQSYEVWTPVQRGPYGRSELEELRRSFYTEHKREYGVYSEEFPVAIVTLRVAAIGLTHANQLPQSSSDKRAESLGVTQRIAHFGSERKVDVYQWEELAEHRKVVGPAIVEEADTVVILPPGSEAELDSYQNLIVSVGSEVAD
jgi:N-methylhydantoinase A